MSGGKVVVHLYKRTIYAHVYVPSKTYVLAFWVIAFQFTESFSLAGEALEKTLYSSNLNPQWM